MIDDENIVVRISLIEANTAKKYGGLDDLKKHINKLKKWDRSVFVGDVEIIDSEQLDDI